MDMMSHAYDRHLAELVAEGKVSEATIDDAVRRVLRVKMRLGLFDNPYTPDVPDRFLRPADLKIASELAAESMVLLKNDSTLTLPLRNVRRIAVIGPLADNGKDLLGNWLGHGQAEDVVTLREGIAGEFGKDSEIRYARGCALDGHDRSGFKAALDTARWADVVVLCLGESLRWSGENASRVKYRVTCDPGAACRGNLASWKTGGACSCKRASAGTEPARTPRQCHS